MTTTAAAAVAAAAVAATAAATTTAKDEKNEREKMTYLCVRLFVRVCASENEREKCVSKLVGRQAGSPQAERAGERVSEPR